MSEEQEKFINETKKIMDEVHKEFLESDWLKNFIIQQIILNSICIKK